jgi:hypothetical protein
MARRAQGEKLETKRVGLEAPPLCVHPLQLVHELDQSAARSVSTLPARQRQDIRPSFDGYNRRGLRRRLPKIFDGQGLHEFSRDQKTGYFGSSDNSDCRLVHLS